MDQSGEWQKAADILNLGGVAILPTDTIYGFHCKALKVVSVNRIYQLKGRDVNKPFIVLIPDRDSLKLFGIQPDYNLNGLLNSYWPGPNSIILPVNNPELFYLHRGTNSLAFRNPDFPRLNTLLNKTGPLVSTSVNVSGQEIMTDMEVIKSTFGERVDYYINIGELNNPPSNIYKYENNSFIKIR